MLSSHDYKMATLKCTTASLNISPGFLQNKRYPYENCVESNGLEA